MEKFRFKPFEEMTPEDYQRVGFKSGLEIHQQLLTKKKLFCRCPAGQYSKEYDAEILRHMRPTLSEMGVYDGTALMEFKTKKNITYRINRDTVCTYEMDDTPPFLIDEEALEIAIGIGMLFKCNIIDEMHIARKQYLDGSIPTGFQRTAIYALNGSIPYKNRQISIVQMSIEEDSCREVSDIGHERVYLTDRLGMPLIETVTGPDMKTPVEVAEVARILANVARSTGRVRRGMGSAREDVNVSVRGGTRIEIKGVPRISMIPLLTYNEAKRQWNLLRLRDELKNRGITIDTFEAESKDVSTLLKNPHFLPLKEAVEKNQNIQCVVLKGYHGLLHWETQTETYFSKEISDRLRVIACLTTIPNMVHSDSKGDTLTSSEWRAVKRAVGAGDADTMVIVWGDKGDTETAVKEIIIRAKEATIGVPSETRQALRDGTNGFERILPGADRMYPDTDLPPKRITREKLEEIKKWLPELYLDRIKWYSELGVPADIRRDLSISPMAPLFKELVSEKEIDPRIAATTIINFPKRMKRKRMNVKFINADLISSILNCYKNNIISRDGILKVMEEAIKLGKFYPELLPAPCTMEELDIHLERAEGIMSDLKLRNPAKKAHIKMGIIMKELRGRIDAKIVAEKVGFISGEAE